MANPLTVSTSIDLTMHELAGRLNGSQSTEIMQELAEYGYVQKVSPEKWYNNALEGEREWLANKLIKHGYPKRGKNSKAEIEAAVKQPFNTKALSIDERKKLVGSLSVYDVVRALKTWDVKMEEVVRQWVR